MQVYGLRDSICSTRIRGYLRRRLSGPNLSVHFHTLRVMSRLHAQFETSTESRRALILVVEDELPLRELMKTCLEVEGFDVITAANGLEGLRRYKENKDQVQVVVTDLDWPAMNGSDMVRQIFKITPAINVIVATGHCFGDATPHGQCIGMRCLQKPYTGRELTDAVHLLLYPSS